MEARPLSSRPYFRSEPIGTITIDSPLPPAIVLANLRARGQEWRDSRIPEDLRKLDIRGLTVETRGSEFETYWVTRGTLVYNPLCFGIVQPYGDGSRIRAGFKSRPKEFLLAGLIAATAVLKFFDNRSIVDWAIFAFLAITSISIVARHRSAEPMRRHLIDVLSRAAKEHYQPIAATPQSPSESSRRARAAPSSDSV